MMSFPLFEKYVNNDWAKVLKSEFEANSAKLQELNDNILSKYRRADEEPVYPRCRRDIFKAFSFTTFANTKVVIMGQEPYHDANACGLSFSICAGKPLTRSLSKISEVLSNDVGHSIPQNNGCLESWASQGVLLLNVFLTVGTEACSHENIGWDTFTDIVIRKLNAKNPPVFFLLWGTKAGDKSSLICEDKYIKSYHPSQRKCYDSSREGYVNFCDEEHKPFSGANDFLAEKGSTLIDWRLSE
jgi:uracil-DNA glycosylase